MFPVFKWSIYRSPQCFFTCGEPWCDTLGGMIEALPAMRGSNFVYNDSLARAAADVEP